MKCQHFDFSFLVNPLHFVLVTENNPTHLAHIIIVSFLLLLLLSLFAFYSFARNESRFRAICNVSVSAYAFPTITSVHRFGKCKFGSHSIRTLNVYQSTAMRTTEQQAMCSTLPLYFILFRLKGEITWNRLSIIIAGHLLRKSPSISIKLRI